MAQCSGRVTAPALLLLAGVGDFHQGPAWVGRDTGRDAGRDAACEAPWQQLGLPGGCAELPGGSTAPPCLAERMRLDSIRRAPCAFDLGFSLAYA